MEALTGLVGVLTGLMSVVLSLGIAFWAIYWNYQKKRLQYNERQLMIERGMMPPPTMPDEMKRVTPEDALRRGLVLLFLGIGCGIGYVVLLRSGSESADAWLAGVGGAIVGSIGLGYLAYYLVVRNSIEASDQTSATR